MCSHPSKRYELLQSGPANVQQFIEAGRIATDWFSQCAASIAIQRISTDSCTFRDKSVAIRRATTDCCKFARPMVVGLVVVVGLPVVVVEVVGLVVVVVVGLVVVVVVGLHDSAWDW